MVVLDDWPPYWTHARFNEVSSAMGTKRFERQKMTTVPFPSQTRTTVPAISLDHITKGFTATDRTKFLAVDDLSLTIQKGEVVAFLGPNGAGKSTTIDMMLGLTKPDDGQVQVLGLEPLRASRTGLVSAVMQTGGLLPNATVQDVIKVFASLWSGADENEAIARAGLAALQNRRISKLSGGEQQRLRFALALLPNPEVLILDEPTAGMDVKARREFWQAVRADAALGRTVLFATHYLEEADEFADRVILIDKGRVIADGTTAEIRGAFAKRVVSAVLTPADRARFATLPDVTEVSVRGDRTYFSTVDPDSFLSRLIAEGCATEVEVTTNSLDEAFLRLTAPEVSDMQKEDAR